MVYYSVYHLNPSPPATQETPETSPSSHICPVAQMSSNRFDLGGSTMDEERPIISGHSDKEDFVKALSSYLTSMKERCPNVNHTLMDWLSNGFSISMDQDQSVVVPPDQSGLATVREMVRHKLQSVLQPLDDMKQRWDEHSNRHTVID